MVAVGLFALIMTLASGAYLVMISINRQTQSITAGIDDISFALETMTRSIRTGGAYSCVGSGDCSGGGNSFSFVNTRGATVTYSRDSSSIQETINDPQSGTQSSALTDPLAITINSLTFYVSGTGKSDPYQPHVTIIISGTTHGKQPESFTVETGATMRGADI
jgi:hypothetical protein